MAEARSFPLIASEGIIEGGIMVGAGGTAACTPPTQSADFVEANTDYIEVPDHADFSPGNGAMSGCAWIDMDDATNFYIMAKGAYGTTGEWWFRTDGSDKLNIFALDESVAPDSYIGRSYNTAITGDQGSWVFVAFTKAAGTTSSTFKLYKGTAPGDLAQVDDTDLESNAANFIEIENLAGAFRAGNDNGATWADGKGSLLGFWNGTELSLAQLQSIMNKTYSCLIASEKTNLKLWMDLDGDVVDSVGTHTPVNHGADFVADSPSW